MSFINTLLYRKKHSKAASKTKPAYGSEDLTEDSEDDETTNENDGANPKDDAYSKEDAAPEDDSEVEYEVVEREILPAKIICPDCGGITLEGLEFCDKCGGELQ